MDDTKRLLEQAQHLAPTPAFDIDDVRWLKSEGAQLVVLGGTWESIMRGFAESSRQLDQALGH